MSTVVALEKTSHMPPRIAVFFAQMEDERRGTLRYVEGMDPEQLSWTPQANVESIGTQLLHIAAVERSWIGEDIDRRSMGEEWMLAFPIRFGMAQISGKPLEYFRDTLESVRAETRAVLSRLSDDDLARQIAPLDPGDSSDVFTIEWILHHIVDHEAHHKGQIALLKRLYAQSRI